MKERGVRPAHGVFVGAKIGEGAATQVTKLHWPGGRGQSQVKSHRLRRDILIVVLIDHSAGSL